MNERELIIKSAICSFRSGTDYLCGLFIDDVRIGIHLGEIPVGCGAVVGIDGDIRSTCSRYGAGEFVFTFDVLMHVRDCNNLS